MSRDVHVVLHSRRAPDAQFACFHQSAVVRRYLLDASALLQWRSETVDAPEQIVGPQWAHNELDVLAVNRVLCAARRNSAARDAIELDAPLGPLVWAVSGKTPDMAPPSILRAIRANTFGYVEEEVETVRMEDGSRMEWRRLRQALDQALEVASDYCAHIAPMNIPAACSSRLMTPRSLTERPRQEPFGIFPAFR